MGRRYYRRRNKNSTGALVRDTVEVGNRLPWWGAAMMGVLLFSIFFWVVPAWIHYQWESNPVRSPLGDMVRQVFERRLHWIQYLGIVLGLIGVFFAIKNYFWSERLSRQGEHDVGFFSRLLGRLLD